MTSLALRSALACSAALAALALSTPASAALAFNPGDFGVIEGLGQYTVFDHSADWYIYGFSVTNPHVTTDHTSRPGWFAGTCGSGCGTNDMYQYFNLLGPFDFTHDIHPGETDSRFFFGGQPASQFTVFLTNSNFATTQVSGPASHGGAPEPAGWALMITGFGLAGAALRRRRAGPKTA